MGNNSQSFAKKLPAITLIIAIIAGTLSTLILGFQLNNISLEQQSQLGKILSSQLAKSARDPIIRQDKLSLQVEVDELLTTQSVEYAAVMNADNQLIVEAEREPHRSSTAGLFIHPISIENTVAGYATIQLNQDFFQAPLQNLKLMFISLWVITFTVFLFFTIKLGKNLSRRLNYLAQKLPDNETGNLDELSCLEHRIAPLLATRDSAQESSDLDTNQKHFALLAMSCKNLPRLETLLNAENFEWVMTQFDRIIDNAIDLYGGKRLSTGQSTIFLEFVGSSMNSDHPLRAVYCAIVIRQLSQQLLVTQGVELEFTGAISHGTQTLTASLLLNERVRQNQIEALKTLLKTAVPGEILTEKETAEHIALEGTSLSPLTADSPLFRLEKLSGSSQQLIDQQLLLLHQNYHPSPHQ